MPVKHKWVVSTHKTAPSPHLSFGVFEIIEGLPTAKICQTYIRYIINSYHTWGSDTFRNIRNALERLALLRTSADFALGLRCISSNVYAIEENVYTIHTVNTQ